jgi:hypothetical protein
LTADIILDTLADALADRVADRVAERLAGRVAPAVPPEMATAKHNPMGNARAFLDAAREGKFPSGRRGREVVALWQDVESYQRSRVRPRACSVGDGAREAALRRHGAL